jgi:hypothetical protein
MSACHSVRDEMRRLTLSKATELGLSEIRRVSRLLRGRTNVAN